MAMSAQQRQDILLYCAKGFNTKQTRDAMLLDACKLHGFQTHSVPSLRSIQRARVRYTKHGTTLRRDALLSPAFAENMLSHL